MLPYAIIAMAAERQAFADYIAIISAIFSAALFSPAFRPATYAIDSQLSPFSGFSSPLIAAFIFTSFDY
jgi:hypothetical protein